MLDEIRRVSLIRISLPYIFNLATNLEPLSKLPDARSAPYSEVMVPILIAHNALSGLVSGNIFSPYLRSSWVLSQQLIESLKLEIDDKDYDREIDQWRSWKIKNNFEQYKIALLAELGALDSYFVTQKGGYDNVSLLAFGENLFPADLTAKVPEALFDAREAGRCLAYENNTAAGFHLFRLLESVLRRYYSHLTDGKSSPKIRNISVYVNALKQTKKGDDKVFFILKNISDLYRNPLIHPDTVLNSEEAIAIFGIVRTAVTQMLLEIPQQPQTTSSPIV